MMLINPYVWAPVAGGGTGGTTDPFAAYVKSLMHFDGLTTPATFTDGEGMPVTVHGATKSGAQSLFGDSSLAVGPGSYITVGPDPSLALVAGPFTLEFAMYFSAPLQSGKYILGSTDGPWIWFNTSLPGLSLMLLGNGLTIVTTLLDSHWYRFAITRDASNTMRLFVDGVLTVDTGPLSPTNQAGAIGWEIGCAATATGTVGTAGTAHPGFIDEWRLTVGACRYTANYTPATAAFP